MDGLTYQVKNSKNNFWNSLLFNFVVLYYISFIEGDLIVKEFYLKPKFLSSIKGYTKDQLAKDLVAGLIVAIIAMPLSIAFLIILIALG